MMGGSATTRSVLAAWAACSALLCPGCQTEQSAEGTAPESHEAAGLPLPAAPAAPVVAASAPLPLEEHTSSDAGVSAPGPGLRCTTDTTQLQKTDYSKPGRHAVAKLDLTFEDTSRPIAASDKHAAAPARTLVTTIYYPTGPERPLFGDAPVASGGPFPLVMYSHGYSSTRGESTQVGERAASYGYVVVAPDFPLSNLFANNGAPEGTDAHNQAGDVSFLIDQMLAFSRDPEHLFANAIDETRIGATGVSMGGFTTLLATFHPTLHDARIKVAVPMAPLSALFREGFYHTRDVPVLFVHGDLDAFLKYEHTRRAFEFAQPNARLVTFAKGTHAAFAMQLDDITQELLNATLGLPGSHPTNPDGLGCGAVAQDLSKGSSVGVGLGGEENFIDQDTAAKMQPCTGDEYKQPAMNATEQVDLAATAVVSMFEAYFAETAETRSDACRYLVHELPKHPSVSVE